MTRKQYELVKTFLGMGNSPKEIANQWKINLMEVLAVQATHNYEQFNESNGLPGSLNDLFGGLI